MQATTPKDKKYVVINIGSSSITGMLSIKHPGGLVQPIAMSRQPSRDNVKRGYIHNIDGTAKSIGLIIDELSAQLEENEKISSVYVGLECVSMRSRVYRSQLTLPHGGEIVSHEHLQTLRDQVQDADYGKDEVVRVLHPRFFVDGKPEMKPQGVRCQRIDAVYQVITARKNILENLRTTFEQKLALEINDILITPVAEATTILSSQEAMLGCVYVNIGGGCTSVSLYKDRLLSGLYVLPMGGRDVTKDLESLSLVESYAEQVKLTKAAMSLEVDRNEAINIEGVSIKQIDINRTVMARMVEIMLNVINIVSEASAGEQSNIASWVLTGGATQLMGFVESIEGQIGQPVRVGGIRPEFVSGAVSEAERASYVSELALTHLASKDCIELVYQAMDILTQDPVEEDVLDANLEDLPIGSDEPDQSLEIAAGLADNGPTQAVPSVEQRTKAPSRGSGFWGSVKKGFMGMIDKINGEDEDEYED
ncbi:MAG: cell division FtsA domain-containing protein [Porphyromonadaceae bacterium]|nr:cell division FtsA domain-containing protein [Porphyromonadaceae bacterium]